MATQSLNQAFLPPLAALVTSRAYTRMQEQSAAYENSHFFLGSREAELKTFMTYNKSDAKKYILIFDCPTPAVPGTLEFQDADFDGVQSIIKTPTEPTWTTGTKVRFTSNGLLPSPLVANKDYFIYEEDVAGDHIINICDTLNDVAQRNYLTLAGNDGAATHTMHVNDWVEFVFPVSAQSQAALDFYELGWKMTNGIFCMGSTVDTGYTTAGANFIFSAVYGAK